ncbi:MAG: cell division protein SepF [Acidimicrobiales bacterium]
MSAFRRMMSYLGLVDDDDYDDYGSYDSPSSPQSAAGPMRPMRAPGQEQEPVGGVRTMAQPVPFEQPSGITVTRPSVVRPIAPSASAKVYTLTPGSFSDVQEVGDRLKAGTPVIVNLQGVDRDLGRRIIDFASGLSYGIGATIEKAADRVLLLTPNNVEVSEDEKRRLQERGLYRS